MSVGIEIKAPELARLEDRLASVANMDFGNLLDGLGSIVESQTRRRIQDEKTTPEALAWADWSEAYAASKHGASKGHLAHPGELRSSQGHTLLQLDGGLLDSMQSLVSGREVEIGSNLVYANFQNTRRQFLGLSPDNTEEAIEVIEDFLDGEFRALK